MRLKIKFIPFVLTLICILFYQSSNAQKNYSPGYYTSIKGDTVQGFIDYRNWQRNPNKINFKTKIDGDPIIYSSKDIKGFGVNNEIYKSAVVDAEKSPYQTGELEFNSNIQLRSNDTTFLQTIVYGSKSLFFNKDINGKNQFYIYSNSEYKLLVYKKYFKIFNEKKVIAEKNEYKKFLAAYLGECSDISSKLIETDYTLGSLKKLFLYYYECSNEKLNYQKKNEKFSTDFGIIAGVSMTKLVFQDDSFDYLVGTDFQASTNFTAGIFLDLILPRNQGKWSIYNELIYTSYEVNGKYEEIRSANTYDKYAIELGFSFIKLTNMLRYKFPVGKSSLYLNGGVSNGFVISETNKLVKETKVFSNVTITESTVGSNPYKSHELGLTGGIGALINKYSLEIRYEKGSGVSDYMSSYTDRIYLLFGYHF